MAKAPLRLGILISGRGSNMAAIAHACRERRIDAEVCFVLADRPEARGLEIARDLAIDTAIVHFRDHPERASFDRALGAVLAARAPDLIALAGFMRILPPDLVDIWSGRMLNIHPSLLPRHPGLMTHRRVLEAGETEHGASVHYVTMQLDGGPVVLQSRVRVEPQDNEASLSARVQSTEHIIYPRVIGWIAAGRLAWQDGRPMLDGRPLTAPIVEEFP
jgi:phosphoribosylglycinamide formyltransferase 1